MNPFSEQNRKQKRPRSPAQIANQFKPGVSGNPGGRPKKLPITERYAEIADKPLPKELLAITDLPEGSTYGDALAMRQFREALAGSTSGAKEITDRLEGKARQPVDVTVSDMDSVAQVIARGFQRVQKAKAKK